MKYKDSETGWIAEEEDWQKAYDAFVSEYAIDHEIPINILDAVEQLVVRSKLITPTKNLKPWKKK